MKKIFSKFKKKENDDLPKFVNVPFNSRNSSLQDTGFNYSFNKYPEEELLFKKVKNIIEEFEKIESDFITKGKENYLYLLRIAQQMRTILRDINFYF